MKAEKKRILLDIFFSIIILMVSIALILIISFINKKKPESLKTFFFSDIYIDSLIDFAFIEDKTIPEYPNYNILGITGKLMLDCYIGVCSYEKEGFIEIEYCEPGGDDCETHWEEETFLESTIERSCSEHCYKTGEQNCTCKYHNEQGECLRKKDDEYIEGKICYCNNAVYFWKGKKYYYLNKSYSYLDDIILKDEACPKRKKNCGIIDGNGNQLCVLNEDDCPLNYISDKQSNNNYNSVLIGNKTFYYGYDSTLKKQLIKGLTIDTDLIPNNNNIANNIIDENTLSSLLEDNKNLFQDVNLGYDPYKINDIDLKGKSYLRITYNEEKVDLSQLRKDRDKSNNIDRMNNDIIDSIRNKTELMIMIGFPSLLYLFIVFLIFMLNQICFFRKGSYGKCKKYCFIIFILIFFALIIAPLIYGCINVGKAKDAQDLDPDNKEYSIFKNLNLAFVIIGIALVLLLIAYMILVPFKFGFKEESDVKVNNYINETNTNVIVNDFK